MKKCINCDYSETPDVGINFMHCNHPKNLEENLVDNSLNREWEFCSTIRNMDWLQCRLFKSCGKAGRWYKEKE